MGGRQLVEIGKHVLGRPKPAPLVQAVRRTILHTNARDDAERAEADACGLEHVRLMRRIHVQHVARNGHESQPRDVAGQRMQLPAGAVRRGSRRAGERLPIDVRQVEHALTDCVEGRAHAAEPRAGAERRL